MKPIQDGIQKILQKIQCAGIAKYRDGHQHSDQVRNYSDGDRETFFGALDEFRIDRYSSTGGIQREKGQQKRNRERRERIEECGDRLQKTNGRSAAKPVGKCIRDKKREKKQKDSRSVPTEPRSHRQFARHVFS